MPATTFICIHLKLAQRCHISVRNHKQTQLCAMADLPENLQVIKVEQPSTPEKANIKERLNLHVKRRLQQDLSASSPETPPSEAALATVSKRYKTTQAKEAQKPRKPYQKRVEKTKADTGKTKKASPAADLESYEEPSDAVASPEMSDTKNVGRERYKNSDILNIVLNSKKKALMQNPEVQLFWSQIMSALKK